MEGNKKNIVLFLGSGASVPYDKPVTKELKQRLLPPENLRRNSFRNAILSCPDYTDFEYIYTAALEIKRFLNSQPGTFFKYLSEELESLSTYREPHTNSSHIPFHKTISEWDEVVKSLEKDVYDNYRWNDKHNEKLKTIISSLVSFLDEYSNDIVICTSNYDQSIETYCDNGSEYRCIDGFKDGRWDKNGFYYPQIDTKKTFIYLYKLHGSLDWKKKNNGIILKTFEESQSADPNFSENILIYPSLLPKCR